MPIKVFSRAVEPFKNFKFRVYVDGRLVAGVSKVTGLKSTTEVVSHRSGGDPSTPVVSPGASKSEPITLERGLTLDHTFEDWANITVALDRAEDVAGELERRQLRLSEWLRFDRRVKKAADADDLVAQELERHLATANRAAGDEP